MVKRRWVSSVCLATTALLAATPPADAQLAPTGSHYGGRPSDTGRTGFVNSTGGYAASLPLDLPAARNGLPVPVQVSYSEHGVGTAGLGWDVPLSYIRRDVTFAHRRPAGSPGMAGLPPVAREQVSLVLEGRRFELVKTASAWVARRDAPGLVAREQADGKWVVFDGKGHTYLFAVAGPPLAGAGLWHLVSVTGAGGQKVRLSYFMERPVVPGSPDVVSIELSSVEYNTDTRGCFKNRVALFYDHPQETPLSISIIGGKTFARVRTLLALSVQSRSTCGAGDKSVRSYAFNYVPDVDTGLPRLSTVNMFGRQGTPAQGIDVPIGRYTYGSATAGGQLTYQAQAAIQVVGAHPLGSTQVDASPHSPDDLGFFTSQSLMDVTGDGRADLVRGSSIARNSPTGPGGSTRLGAPNGAANAQLGTSPLEKRTTHGTRYNLQSDRLNDDMVWRQAIDVNGDGRMDVMDASEQAGIWAVYLNTPDPTDPTKIVMQRRTYSTTAIAQRLRERGVWRGDDFLPLSLRSTSRQRVFSACVVWTGTHWVLFEDEGPGNCPVGGRLLSTGPETTITQFELQDINGDGYPDVVFNSSGLQLFEPTVNPVPPPRPNGFPVATTRTERFDLAALSANEVQAMLNILGVHTTAGADNAFSAPLTIRTNAGAGVARWVGSDDNRQQLTSSISDVNGDGMADRIEGTSVFLGTGHRAVGGMFTAVAMITLPGALSIQLNDQKAKCAPPATGTTTFVASQLAGLRDVTGDRIPDYLAQDAGGNWKASIGTGTGFTAPIPVVGGFVLSSAIEDCLGVKSSTSAGLFDIDGDGRADIVSSNPNTPNTITVARLIGASGVVGAHDAGRLTQLDNGYGANTIVTYRSAKEDATTLHQLPFPEIVVATVATTGTRGLGGNLAATLYAYGGAEQVFDPALDTFTFQGYRRSVELRIPTAESTGVVTITDTYGPATASDPFGILGAGGTTIPTTQAQRYRRYLSAGRPSDVTLISGSLGSDPWALLATNVATDPRRIAATHYEWDARSLASASDPGGFEICVEMVFPYDYVASTLYALARNTYDVCGAHGFAYGLNAESWRGEPGAAPPSTANVVTRSEVRGIDDLGRVLTEAHLNDLARSADDLCVDTSYAASTGANERVLSAVSSRQVSNCGAKILARDTYLYDELPFGSVASGFLTTHTVERRSDSGALLGTVREFDATYNAVGNPITVTTRREDGATRQVTMAYDAFNMVPVLLTTTATGLPTMTVSVAYDLLSLAVASVTDQSGSQRGTTYDGFDRPVLSTVTTADGIAGALSVTSYDGFAREDARNRKIVRTDFADPVDPAVAASAVGRKSKADLDELGRQIRVDLVLGASYPGKILTVQRRMYDSLGRIVFEADPSPTSEDFTTAYGTTRFYNTDGTPSCFIRAHGRLPAVTHVTDEVQQVYPTCYSRSFQNNTEVVSVRDADSHLASSPQANVIQSSYATAIGQVIARSTWQGSNRLEHATLEHDALGHLVGMTRYQDAATGAKPVAWTWRYDSLGRLLELQEPSTVPQLNTYSDWGELTSVVRVLGPGAPGPGDNVLAIITKYDALGRMIHREHQHAGTVDPATINDYLYDQPVTAAPQVTPTHVLGRLAQAISPTGAVAFSYDGFGNVNARVFTDPQGGMYVEKHAFHGDGSPSTLDLFLPDTGYAQEHVDYHYDSAGRGDTAKYANGPHEQDLFSATSIDPFGRIRAATYGQASLAASYADVGRRLMSDVTVTSPHGSRKISYHGFDPVGRERSRTELKNGAVGTTTTSVYDALGRLSSSVQTEDATSVFNQQYSYDPLGNLLSLSNTGGTQGTSSTTLTYLDTDRDRICRIAYAADNGTACNVVYDGLGNIISQPTRTGNRSLTYFADGNVRTIADGATSAQFRYDAFGEVQELDVTSTTSADTRHDRRYGALLAWRDEAGGSVLSRQIPGPGGLVATRHGAGGSWVFAFGEARGNRFFADETGAFVQDVKYQPFGEPTSTGAQPGSSKYSNHQWNGGDALAAFGLAHLGARVYDPVIGRFLSRDPLLIPRTATTTNPYAFANNDPVNRSDPSGLETAPNGDPENGGDFEPLNPKDVARLHLLPPVYIARGVNTAVDAVGNAISDTASAVSNFLGFGGGRSTPAAIDPIQAQALGRVMPTVGMRSFYGGHFSVNSLTDDVRTLTGIAAVEVGLYALKRNMVVFVLELLHGELSDGTWNADDTSAGISSGGGDPKLPQRLGRGAAGAKAGNNADRRSSKSARGADSLAVDGAEVASRATLGDAKRALRENKDFIRWFHRVYKPSQVTRTPGRHNPDMANEHVVDAFVEWLGTGKPKVK
jgi:RHS repeat-associated protein